MGSKSVLSLGRFAQEENILFNLSLRHWILLDVLQIQATDQRQNQKRISKCLKKVKKKKKVHTSQETAQQEASWWASPQPISVHKAEHFSDSGSQNFPEGAKYQDHE